MHKALWLLPPLVGIGFYAAGSMHAANAVATGPATGSRYCSSVVSLLPPVAGLSALQIQDAAKALAKDGYVELDSRTPAELKALIVKIVQTFRDRGREKWESDPELDPILDAAVTALARQEKGTAWDWMSAQAPEWVSPYISGWMESEPAAAFEAVVHSPLARPCREEDLMQMLQGFAQRNPALLRDACLRVPWSVFSGGASTSPLPSLQLPEGADVRPWIESGVLPELRDHGVDVSAVFRIWMARSPSEALAAWSGGNGPYADAEKSITSLLHPSSLREPQRTAVLAAIASMSSEDQKRISTMMTHYVREHPFARDWADIYLGLIREQEEGDGGEEKR